MLKIKGIPPSYYQKYIITIPNLGNINVEEIKNNIAVEAEEWKECPEYPGYKVTKTGRIKSPNNTILEINPSQCGYIRVGVVREDGKYVRRSLHVLIALTYITNPEGKPIVDHINRVRTDNRVHNLRWVTHSENAKNIGSRKGKNPSKKVDQFDLNGNFIKTWDNIKSVAKELHVSRNHISDTCLGRRESAKGFIWKYVKADVIKDEVWKSMIIGSYKMEVSSHGRVKSMLGYISYGFLSAGYMNFNANGVNCMVHRLICDAFNPSNDKSKTQVDHINGVKTDNYYENLEWVTPSENCIRASNIKIHQYDLNDNYVQTFRSYEEAGNSVGAGKTSIAHTCYGIQKSCKGFKWKLEK